MSARCGLITGSSRTCRARPRSRARESLRSGTRPFSPKESDAGETETPQTPAKPTPPAPTGILTFRTEQIYIASADGSNVKAVTENEGLIYFFYAWSPDSSMLAALATTSREWRYQE